jgi:hypothetical protein
MIVWRCEHICSSRTRLTHGLARSIESDNEGQRCLEMNDFSCAVSKGADPVLSRLAERILFVNLVHLTP